LANNKFWAENIRNITNKNTMKLGGSSFFNPYNPINAGFTS